MRSQVVVNGAVSTRTATVLARDPFGFVDHGVDLAFDNQIDRPAQMLRRCGLRAQTRMSMPHLAESPSSSIIASATSSATGTFTSRHEKRVDQVTVASRRVLVTTPFFPVGTIVSHFAQVDDSHVVQFADHRIGIIQP